MPPLRGSVHKKTEMALHCINKEMLVGY